MLTGQEPAKATGEASYAGPDATADLDIEVLAEVLKGVDDYLKAGRKTLEPELKDRLVAILYERFAATGEPVNQKTIVSYLKLVA